MKSISLAFLCLVSSHVLAASPNKPTFARLMMWPPGERIEWGKCTSQLWEITSTRMRTPRGDEKVRPKAVLELGVLDKTKNENKVYEISVEQALDRGYSLEGLRYRLNDKGWESILAIEIVDGKLNDFVLKPQCEITLEKQEEAEARARNT